MRSIGYSLVVAVILLAVLTLAGVPRTAGQGQDLTFRLMNLERRMDQLQTRVDFLERVQQSQPIAPQGSSATNAAVLDLQRQQLNLAQQMLTMQKQMLELQKKIDQLTPPPNPEKKEKPEERPKPKSPARP